MSRKKKKTTKYYVIKLSLIRRRIELCMRKIILRFEVNFKKFHFFLDSIIHISISKASTEVLNYWAEETLGD
jgi:hypothetical protein